MSEQPTAERVQSHFRVVLVWAVVTASLLVVIVALSVDISAARDFKRDVIVRDAFAGEPLPPIRFWDPSPISIWLSFDWFVWDSLRAGELPVWERLQGGGYSPLVALQAGVLHPLRWFAALFPRESMPSVLIVLTLMIAGMGLHFVAIELGMSRKVATVAALLFVVSSPIVSFMHFSGALVPLAHLPWILWLYRRTCSEGGAWRRLSLTVCIGLLLCGGHPLIVFSVCLAVGVVALADSVVRRSLKPIVLVITCGGAGALVALPALLPPILAAPEMWSYKVSTPDGIAYHPYSLHHYPFALMNVIWSDPAVKGYLDVPPFYELIGMPVLGLLAACVFAARRDANARILSVLTALWFLITVPGPWMLPLARLEPFNYLKPWYYSGAFACFLALSATSGLAYLWRQRTALARALAVCLVGGAIILGGFRLVQVLAPRQWSPIVGGEVIAYLKQAREPLRLTGLWGQVHLPNSARITGIEDVRLSGPFYPTRLRAWWFAVDEGFSRRSYATVPFTDDLRSPLVDDFNVAFVLQSRRNARSWFETGSGGVRDRMLSPRLTDDEFPVVLRTATAELRFNRGVEPRAGFVSNVRTVGGLPEAVAVLRQHASPGLVIVETDQPLRLAAQARGLVAVHYPTGSTVELRTSSDTGGLVVLRDSYADGWSATVDGVPTEIYAVNIVSRGVVVPPGAHRVVMSYTPPGFLPGLAMSAVVLAGMVALAGVKRRQRLEATVNSSVTV